MWPLAAGIRVLAVFAGLAVAKNGRSDDKTFRFAAGFRDDLPYGDLQAAQGVPNLVIGEVREAAEGGLRRPWLPA
jgi:hypothetical protein